MTETNLTLHSFRRATKKQLLGENLLPQKWYFSQHKKWLNVMLYICVRLIILQQGAGERQAFEGSFAVPPFLNMHFSSVWGNWLPISIHPFVPDSECQFLNSKMTFFRYKTHSVLRMTMKRQGQRSWRLSDTLKCCCRRFKTLTTTRIWNWRTQVWVHLSPKR